MSGIALYGQHVFVVLQRLTGFTALHKGKVVVINAETDKIVKSIDLNYKNPIHCSVHGKYLYLSCTEYFGLTGGIERINMEIRKHGGTVVSEENLDGNAMAFSAVSNTKGYAIIGKDWPVNIVRTVDIP
jgi:hypothetical protein